MASEIPFLTNPNRCISNEDQREAVKFKDAKSTGECDATSAEAQDYPPVCRDKSRAARRRPPSPSPGVSNRQKPPPVKPERKKVSGVEMVLDAIRSLKESRGSTEQAISKFVMANYGSQFGNDEKSLEKVLCRALKQGMKLKLLAQSKRGGIRYRLGPRLSANPKSSPERRKRRPPSKTRRRLGKRKQRRKHKGHSKQQGQGKNSSKQKKKKGSKSKSSKGHQRHKKH